MRFLVEGADRATGQEGTAVNDANSADGAKALANQNGLYVSKCKFVGQSPTNNGGSKTNRHIRLGRQYASVWRGIAAVLILGFIIYEISAMNHSPPTNLSPSSFDSPKVAAFKKIAAIFESKDFMDMSENDDGRLSKMLDEFDEIPFDAKTQTADAKQMLEEWHSNIEGRFGGSLGNRFENEMLEIEEDYVRRNN